MIDQDIIRWGILGAARVNQRLLPAIVEARHSRLVAIASRRPGAAKAILKQYAPEQSGVETYDQLEAIIEHPGIDAVYIPLANHEHVEWTLKAIKNGKHVLCEKPMALRSADIAAIQQAAQVSKVKVMEGFMYRFHPQHQRVRELLNSGIIGDVCSARATFSFMMKPAREYRLTETLANGGGALWDIGCYAIHSARMWMDGLPQSVIATGYCKPNGADLASSGIIDYGNGRLAVFDYSFQRARRSEYEIIGSEGGIKCHTVWQNPGDVPVISWWTEAGRSATEELIADNHFTLEVEHFNHSILNDKAPALSLSDASENCAVLEATLKSIESGQREKIFRE